MSKRAKRVKTLHRRHALPREGLREWLKTGGPNAFKWEHPEDFQLCDGYAQSKNILIPIPF